MNRQTGVVGQPLDRVDGRLKVTGRAHYSADVPAPNLVHAVMITSTIACGHVAQIDAAEAEQLPGVLAVLTPFNAPRLPGGSIREQGSNQQSESPQGGAGGQRDRKTGQAGGAGSGGNQGGQQAGQPGKQQGRPPDRKIHLLQEDDVFYNGQPIGLVVAETIEQAMHAASVVKVRYREERPALQMARRLNHAYTPKSAGGHQDPPDTRKGDVDRGWQGAEARIDEVYVTPVETHNAMEPHATLAMWDGDHLTLYDASQGIFTARKRIAGLFGLPPESVRIITHFVGGGFGSKGPVWSHVVLAAMAARQVGRPVKLVLTRRQMFGPVGFRGETQQRLRLASGSDGVLALVQHDNFVQSSMFDEFVEPAGITARMLYTASNMETSHRVVRLNSGTPSFMRAPGEAPGVYALECAMDELARRLKMDPIELRLRNYADADPESGKPWSSKSLRDCYQVGAERFGWGRRTPEPRSMRDGSLLVGLGMASSTYPTHRSPSSARARLMPDGTALVQSGTQDIGTGTYTIMTQIAADALGLKPERVRFELGDTTLPETPVSGGSQTAASTGSAVYLAANALRSKLVQAAIQDPASPLHGLAEAEVDAGDGRLFSTADNGRGETYSALVTRMGVPSVEARADAAPGDEQQKYSMHAFGAHFAEVTVDPDLGEIRVTRYVGVFAAGRILNAKTARNQFMGGITFGIGMALMEQTHADPRSGRIMNADLAEYHLPVNADIPDIEIHVVEESDPYVNPIGVKGIGEIGIVGAPAAVANAVFHATGKRVRDLPITVDKILG